MKKMTVSPHYNHLDGLSNLVVDVKGLAREIRKLSTVSAAVFPSSEARNLTDPSLGDVVNRGGVTSILY